MVAPQRICFLRKKNLKNYVRCSIVTFKKFNIHIQEIGNKKRYVCISFNCVIFFSTKGNMQIMSLHTSSTHKINYSLTFFSIIYSAKNWSGERRIQPCIFAMAHAHLRSVSKIQTNTFTLVNAWWTLQWVSKRGSRDINK